jgi:hypothetical protein
MAWHLVKTYQADARLDQRIDLINDEIDRTSQLTQLRQSPKQAEASASSHVPRRRADSASRRCNSRKQGQKRLTPSQHLMIVEQTRTPVRIGSATELRQHELTCVATKKALPWRRCSKT